MSSVKFNILGIGCALLFALAGQVQALTIADGTYGLKNAPTELQQMLSIQRDATPVVFNFNHKKSNIVVHVSDDASTFHFIGRVQAVGASIKGKKLWFVDIVLSNVEDLLATAGNANGTISQRFGKKRTFEVTDSGSLFTFKYPAVQTLPFEPQDLAGPVNGDDDPPQSNNDTQTQTSNPSAVPEPATAALGLIALATLVSTTRRRR